MFLFGFFVVYPQPVTGLKHTDVVHLLLADDKKEVTFHLTQLKDTTFKDRSTRPFTSSDRRRLSKQESRLLLRAANASRGYRTVSSQLKKHRAQRQGSVSSSSPTPEISPVHTRGSSGISCIKPPSRCLTPQFHGQSMIPVSPLARQQGSLSPKKLPPSQEQRHAKVRRTVSVGARAECAPGKRAEIDALSAHINQLHLTESQNSWLEQKLNICSMPPISPATAELMQDAEYRKKSWD